MNLASKTFFSLMVGLTILSNFGVPILIAPVFILTWIVLGFKRAIYLSVIEFLTDFQGLISLGAKLQQGQNALNLAGNVLTCKMGAIGSPDLRLAIKNNCVLNAVDSQTAIGYISDLIPKKAPSIGGYVIPSVPQIYIWPVVFVMIVIMSLVMGWSLILTVKRIRKMRRMIRETSAWKNMR